MRQNLQIIDDDNDGNTAYVKGNSEKQAAEMGKTTATNPT